MRRPGIVVTVVCFAVVKVIVGRKTDFAAEENVDGVLKRDNVEISKGKDFGRNLREIRSLEMTVDTRHIQEIPYSPVEFDEFDKMINKSDINFQGRLQNGIEFRQMAAKKEDFNRSRLKKSGLKKFSKNIRQFKGTSQKRVNLKKIRHKKEIRMKREADEDYSNEKIKSITITKEVKVPYAVRVTKLVPQPVRVEVERPVPVRVPRPVPVRVERVVRYPVKMYVPAPYPVVKHVPVFVRHHVVRPVPVRVAKPYPVIVERRVPVPVMKKVLHPVHIPVQVPVPVLQPLVSYVLYPVHKRVLHPVEVPVSKPVPYPVDRPYPVLVEKRVPYPVVKHVPYPVPVEATGPAKSYGPATHHGHGSDHSYDYAS